MAIGVHCKNCVHYEKCNAERIKMGIKTYVESLVDCDGYKKRTYPLNDLKAEKNNGRV